MHKHTRVHSLATVCTGKKPWSLTLDTKRTLKYNLQHFVQRTHLRLNEIILAATFHPFHFTHTAHSRQQQQHSLF